MSSAADDVRKWRMHAVAGILTGIMTSPDMTIHRTPAPLTSLASGALRRRTIGACVGAGFGALWGVMALNQWHAPAWAKALAALPSLLLVFAAACIGRALRRRGLRPASGETRGNRLRGFVLVVIAKVVALNIAAGWLLSRWADLWVPVIAVIVGLHFLPLAKVLWVARVRITGLAMTAIGVTAMLAIAAGGDPVLYRSAACIGCALVLWGTALSAIRERRDLLKPAGAALAGSVPG